MHLDGRFGWKQPNVATRLVLVGVVSAVSVSWPSCGSILIYFVVSVRLAWGRLRLLSDLVSSLPAASLTHAIHCCLVAFTG